MSAFVRGKCPACEHTGLFVGAGNYITCSWMNCPEPDAASRVLNA